MKKETRSPFPFWATSLTVLGVGILCTLGTWQIQRLAWKQEIINKLDHAYEQSGTTPLSDFSQDYTYGYIEGRFLADKALLLGPRTRDSKIGNDVLVPLALEDGHTLIVNLGWTDLPLESLPIHHANGQTIRFEGLARRPSWNSFTPENQPEHEQWYRADPIEITAVRELENPLPVILYAEHASYKFDAAFPNNLRQYPNNNHLQYAIFWFTMAGAMILIYALRFLIPRTRPHE